MALKSFFRLTVRNVLLALFGVYLCVVLLFYTGIQKSQSHPKQDDPVESVVNEVLPGAPAMAAKAKLNGQNIDDLPLYIKRKSDTFVPKYKAMKEDTPGYLDPGRRMESKPKSHQHQKCIGSNKGREFDFVEVVADRVFVYSAYWDTRPNDFDNKRNGTFVRIMAVVRSASKKGQAEISCKFQTNDNNIVQSTATYYEMCENHGQPFGGFILSCPVPQEVDGQPCSVSVSESSSDDHTSLTVLPLSPKEDMDEFVTCVPPLYGNMNVKKLVEFVEMSRLLGAQRITFYDYQINEDIAEVLEYYQDQEQVDVIPWIYPNILERGSWYHGQLIAVQDCLYRNMHSAEYITFNDLDEYIVAHEHEDWAQMVDQTFQPQQCAYQFLSSFFETKGIDENDTIVLSATKRSSQLNSIRTKCMVKPYQIFEMGIHHVSKPIFAHLKVEKMQENVAFIHHYRQCMKDYGMNCKDVQNDKTLMKHAKILSDNMERTLKRMKIKKTVH